MFRQSCITRLLATVALSTLAGCGSNDPAPAARPTATADGPGTITGTIVFEGTPPPRPALRMASDPNCEAIADGSLSETVVVGPGGGLQNVFVYVRDGIGDRTYAVPTEPVVLDQQGCRYVPHVLGIQAGQPLQIMNSDATLHNVHAVPRENQEFNFGQPQRGMQSTRVFDRPEMAVPIRCDVHPWMNAWVGVVSHPFYAVTGEDGTFEIRGLPPGTYVVEAWHEQLGTQTQTITVTEDAPGASLELTFRET